MEYNQTSTFTSKYIYIIYIHPYMIITEERKRISDEITLLRSLKNVNIIQFISAWINKKKKEVVFISEVVTGGSLKKYINLILVT